MPQLTTEQRAELIAMSADHTQAECAEKFGVSRSTVARTLKSAAASSQQAQASSANTFASDEALQFEPPAPPDAPGTESFVFETEGGDGGAFDRLLDSQGQEQRDAAEAAAAAIGDTGGNTEEKEEVKISEGQADSILSGLGLDPSAFNDPTNVPDSLDAQPKQPRRARARKQRVRIEAPEVVETMVPEQAELIKQRALPDCVLQQKLRLLCTSFDEMLQPLLGSDNEREQFRKKIRALKGETLRVQLEEVDSFLVLQTSTDMCEQGLQVTCAVIESGGQYVGLRTQGYCQHVKAHQSDKLNGYLKLAVIENFESFRKRNSPTLLVASCLISSIGQVHAANMQLEIQQTKATEQTAVPLGVAQEYKNL
jgi:hypothetical protein